MKRYQLLGEIGTGGMGAVFLGRDEDGNAVAIKKQHAHLVDDPDAVARFFDEARLAARIDHHNVVSLIEVTITGGDLVLVMEYIEGASLSTLQRLMSAHARRALHWTEVLRVMADALRGLHAAHELRDRRGRLLGVIHRDVSPQNLLVGIDGSTRVADFGVARAAGRLKSTHTDNVVAGKLRYLSPEQIQRGVVDRRADVFAAGIVLWENLTGRRLFGGATEAETITSIVRGPIEPPGTYGSEIPLEVDEICLRALERDPRRRFATAAEFAEALEAAGAASHAQVAEALFDCAGEQIRHRQALLAAPPDEKTQILESGKDDLPTERLSRSAPRTVAPATVVALLLGLVVGGASVGFFSRRTRPDPTPATTETSVDAGGATSSRRDAGE